MAESKSECFKMQVLHAQDFLNMKPIFLRAVEATGLETEKNKGPRQALNQVFDMIQTLQDDDELSQFYVGCVKETKDQGNTSVSFGIVSSATKVKLPALVLNCGSQGIKFQLMDEKKGVLYVKHETKPGKNVRGPNDLIDATLTEWENAAQDLCHFIEEFSAEHPFEIVYVAVTGDIRNKWANAPDEVKLVWEEKLDRYFELLEPYVAPGCSSYCITQEQEAQFELQAAIAMYANLKKANKITQPVRVVASMGIGGASTQIGCVRAHAGFEWRIGMANAMANAEAMTTLSSQFKTAWRGSKRMEWHAEFASAKEAGMLPLIALKSGFLIALETIDWQKAINEYIEVKKKEIEEAEKSIVAYNLLILEVTLEKAGAMFTQKQLQKWHTRRMQGFGLEEIKEKEKEKEKEKDDTETVETHKETSEVNQSNDDSNTMDTMDVLRLMVGL